MKKLSKILLPIYLYCVLNLTLLDRKSTYRRAMLRPFWEWEELFTSGNTAYWFGQIGGNLIMLFPLGILLPLISEKFQKCSVLMLTAFSFSVSIEVTQYFTCRGLLEFDDVFHNTLGAMLGYAVWYLFFVRLKIKRY